MRDVFHIGGLFLVFAFLVTRFPSDLPLASEPERGALLPFASFVTFSPAAHAARLEAARTSWQVRSRARGRPAIGSLDSDIPLLMETLPPPETGGFATFPAEISDLPPPDVETYALLPPTSGADMPDFVLPARRTETVDLAMPTSNKVFGRDEMLSTENSRTLKEIMK